MTGIETMGSSDKEIRSHWKDFVVELDAQKMQGTKSQPKDCSEEQGKETGIEKDSETRRKDTLGEILNHCMDWIMDSRNFNGEQKKTALMIAKCKTPDLGGYLDVCDRCGKIVGYRYKSCGNRFCPKCQSYRSEKWLSDRKAEMIPGCLYFHGIVTVPHEANPLIAVNPVLLNALIRCAAKSFIELCKDPKYLGATPGVICVLHTHASDLSPHYHCHCLISGGGLNDAGKYVDLRKLREEQDRERQIRCAAPEIIPARKPSSMLDISEVLDTPASVQSLQKDYSRCFFLPELLVAAHFRENYIQEMKNLYKQGKLLIPYSMPQLSDPEQWNQFIESLHGLRWVAHITQAKGADAFSAFENVARYVRKPMVGDLSVDEKLFEELSVHTEAGLPDAAQYLSRSVDRMPFDPNNIVSYTETTVSFLVRDRKAPGGKRVETKEIHDFVTLFLYHVLPKGFSRIRSFGILSNGQKKRNLETIFSQLSDSSFTHAKTKFLKGRELIRELFPCSQFCICPICGGNVRQIAFGIAYEMEQTIHAYHVRKGHSSVKDSA